MFTQKDNSGALFHKAKKGSENAPDYTGECVVNGVAMQIAGWRKTSAKGTVYLSLAFKPAGEYERKPKEDTSDIPF